MRTETEIRAKIAEKEELANTVCNDMHYRYFARIFKTALEWVLEEPQR